MKNILEIITLNKLKKIIFEIKKINYIFETRVYTIY